MLGKKFAIAPIVSPLTPASQGLTIEGKRPGVLTLDVAGHAAAWEKYGHAGRLALGDINVPCVFAEVKDGLWDARIDSFARTIKDYPYPLFVNYWLEADTTGLHGVAEDFKAAIRRIHDRVEAIAPKKVTWVAPTIWIPIQAPAAAGAPIYHLFYPGDDYVDWHGFSFYCWNAELAGARYVPAKVCLEQMRVQLRGLAGKPVMFEQFGLKRDGPFRIRTDQDRAEWYRDFLREVRGYPEVAAILFMQGDYGGWNTALKATEPAIQVLRRDIEAHPSYWRSTVETSRAE